MSSRAPSPAVMLLLGSFLMPASLAGCATGEAAQPVADGDYLVRTGGDCGIRAAPAPGCRRLLSWDRRTDDEAEVMVDLSHAIVWRFQRLRGAEYRILSREGCPDGRFCDAALTWIELPSGEARAMLSRARETTWELALTDLGLLRIRPAGDCRDEPNCAGLSFPNAVEGRSPVTVGEGLTDTWLLEPAR